jgi:hypothetical protein
MSDDLVANRGKELQLPTLLLGVAAMAALGQPGRPLVWLVLGCSHGSTRLATDLVPDGIVASSDPK